MDARTVMAKSACIWSVSISFTSVRTISGLFMSFGGHDSLIARKVSSTPTTKPTQTPAPVNRTGSVLPIFWTVSSCFSATSSHVLQSGST